MTSAQVVETSVTNNSSFQNYPHPDDHTIRTNNVYKSKTDVYGDGAYVLAKTGHVSCPFNLLRRYVSAANLDLSSSLPFFRSLYFHKATSIYSLRSAGVSYSRMREIVLQAFVELGYQNNLLRLHSLRAGGASAAANAGVSDRLFKRHGRWKTD